MRHVRLIRILVLAVLAGAMSLALVPPSDAQAEDGRHWSFIPPERPALPKVNDQEWMRNAIDYFILARLEEEGLSPAPQANKRTLIRRVTLDLTGLPPTLDEIDAFLADRAPDAYKKIVDRLLHSSRYGEHMARYWLDAARYGDTHGLHLDNERSLWPYREWVIKAFNKNMPFNQFTIEQLAGDLLPNPTVDQLVATGFNRCNVTTSEGGSIDEEYRVRYAVDRVETTSTVWMGLTTGCAVCHDHKYDPISQKEFYQLFAYFNSLTEKAMDGNALLPPPVVKLPTTGQARQLAKLREQTAAIEQAIRVELAKAKYEDPNPAANLKARNREDYVWIDDALPAGAKLAATGGGPESWQLVSQPAHPVYSGTISTTRTARGRSQHLFQGASPGLLVGEGDTLFAYVYLDPENPPKEIMLQFNDGTWEHRATWGGDLIDWGKKDSPSRLPMGPLPETGKWVRLEVEVAKVGLKPGTVINGWAFTQYDGTVYWDKAGIATFMPQDGSHFWSLSVWEGLQRTIKRSSLPKNIQNVIKLARAKRSESQQKLVRDYFLEHVYSETRGIFDPLHKQLADSKGPLDKLEKSIPGTMVMQDMDKPRDAFVLIRGQYDQRGEKVTPGVPALLPPLPDGAPANRLALAESLVDPAHPLTASVIVNRYWQKYFGTGIVKTAEDFGTRGERPTHPLLLDWIATEFIRSGWDVKHMQKLIVTSATYRQSSRVGPEVYQRDKNNRLLARGPRFRMDAEMVRDNALAISGLLVVKIGGKSVKPPQPDGLWKTVGYTGSNTVKFSKDQGAAQYRRSLYTFWKRTAAPPTMLTFDTPSRESCTVRRARTNTPLQALLLMNDEQFVEASRHLAQRMMTEGGPKAEDRITFAFRLATARQPSAEETHEFLNLFDTSLAEYQRDKEAALKLVSVGDSKRDEALDVSELAAWTMVANLILNLDETITKG